MYRRVYHDYKNNKIHLWETVDNVNKHEVFDQPIEYYMPDISGTSNIKDIFGNTYKKASAYNKKTIRELKNMGVKLCESDLSESIKFIQKRYFGKNLKVDMSAFNIANIDIEVAAEGKFPSAKLAEFPINLITIKTSKNQKLVTFGLEPYTGSSDVVKDYRHCENENILLDKFVSYFRLCEVDIVTGWYIDGYDIPYILNRCKKLGIEKSLSPLNDVSEDTHGNVYIAGLIVLDYKALYLEFDKTKLENYSLDVVSKYVTGSGKIVLENGVNQVWKEDWNKFVEYNIHDVLCVDNIDKELGLIELAITFAYQSQIPIEKSLSTIMIITGYMLQYLHARNMVLNDKPDFSKEEYPGAYNFTRPGVYQNVVSRDVESEYPHILIEYNISPETLVMNPTAEQIPFLIKSEAEGIYYRKDVVGVLPTITQNAFDKRKKFKTKQRICDMVKQGDRLESIAEKIGLPISKINELVLEIEEEGGNSKIYKRRQGLEKIIANSMYGVLGSPYFHYYSSENAKAVTFGGVNLIKYLAKVTDDYFSHEFHNDLRWFKPGTTKVEPVGDVVILVDTDSCYICLDKVFKLMDIAIENPKQLVDICIKMNDVFFDSFFERKLQEYADLKGTKQLINFKTEKICTNQVILGDKRYVAEYVYNEGVYYDEYQYSFTGVDVIRSSTPKFCREKLKPIIIDIIRNKNKQNSLSDVITARNEFYKQKVDLIAKPTGVKEISKWTSGVTGIHDFVKHTPYHVKASYVYNYVVDTFDLPWQKVEDGEKVKIVYVKKQNRFSVKCVAFIGSWPEFFDELFKIDFETQYEKTFESPISQFFEIMGWGKIEYETTDMDLIFE